MTRAELLDQITARLSYAIQADMENGVRSLNDLATAEFRCKYPVISEFHQWLHDLYIESIDEHD